MDVSIVGTGYVGLVTGLCLADRGHRVTCVDIDSAKIARLARGVLPFYEPGLSELLEQHLATRFFPTTDLTWAVRESELSMITVGTPLENGAINLCYVKSAAATIGSALASKPDYHVVTIKSTVTPGTTEDCVLPILEAMSGKKGGRDFGLGMNPEFLREGEAVEDFQKPDRLVLGALDDRTYDTMVSLYADFNCVQQIRTNPRTAEMIKYASNGLFATLISFSNEIANLCSVAPNVDVVDVLGAVYLDKRISPLAVDGTHVSPTVIAYLKAGCGFGGSCFPKDVRALIHWSVENDRPAPVLRAVLETNERQPNELLALLRRRFASLRDVRIAVLGLAFKPGTDDIRESPALRVIPSLAAEGAVVVAYDPVANDSARAALGEERINYANSLPEAIHHADAVVLLTAWPEFQLLPQLLAPLENPPVVVDGRRVLDKKRLRRYEGIGWGGDQPSRSGFLVSSLMTVDAFAEAFISIVIWL